jgi:hypothetical protein
MSTQWNENLCSLVRKTSKFHHTNSRFQERKVETPSDTVLKHFPESRTLAFGFWPTARKEEKKNGK